MVSVSEVAVTLDGVATPGALGSEAVVAVKVVPAVEP